MGRWSRALAGAVGATIAGLGVWVAGLKGLSNRAESACFADLEGRPGHGGFSMSRELWPPAFECRLVGASVDPVVVQHRIEAVAAFGWIVVVPSVIAVAVLATVLRHRERGTRRRGPGSGAPPVHGGDRRGRRIAGDGRRRSPATDRPPATG